MPTRARDEMSTVDHEMGSEWPASDRLAMERARARTELALFGHAEPARMGRYQVLEAIAGGGMGFVCAAYDPELDRRVALKVLHPGLSHDDQSRGRLIKEARALARLDHPNVVSVYDVLSHEGRIVIVMELVAGETLASWEATAAPTWREAVAAYVQAGEGLAAAHGLEIIHRDFKPSNAVIGSDGHIRVLDFGLARFAGDGVESVRSGDSGSLATITRTASGTIMGTPGYAAPEQLAGEAVTAASDQFSFCVALHRAVEGVAPFTGTTVETLLTSILTESPVLATDGRHVPAWLRTVLRRGLAADPAHRYGAMRALLSDLKRARGWKRWRWTALAALLIAATVVVTISIRGVAGGSAPSCDGGALEVAAVWGVQQRSTLGAGLARIGTPYAHEVEARVLARLDAQTSEWSSVHRAACLDHGRGAESDAMLDRKMLCLRQRLDDVAAAVGVLDGISADGLARATDVVAGIPSATMCADAARLLTEVDPPATAELGSRVAAVRGRVSVAAALRRAGRVEESVTAIRAAGSEAASTHYAPVIAEAQLEHGRILIARGDHDGATPILRDAMMTALASNLPQLAVEAAARRIYTEGVRSGDLDRLGRDLDYVESMSRSLVGDHFARPLLLNNIGVVYMAAKRPDDALRYFQLAHDAMAGYESADLELTSIDQNTAMLTADPAARAKLARGVWLRLRAALGEHHFSTLRSLEAYALFSADPETACQLITQVCVDYRRMHPTFLDRYVDCESARGFLASELEDHEVAQAAYSAVIEVAAASPDPNLIVWRHLAAGELALLRGSAAQAIASFGAVIDARRDSKHWWVRKEALQAELGLGLAASAAGDRVAAVRHLDVAASGFTELVQLNRTILYRLRLAKARRALASISSGSPEPDHRSHH